MHFKYENTLPFFTCLVINGTNPALKQKETVKRSLLSQNYSIQIDGSQMLLKNEKQPVFASIFVKVFLEAGIIALYKCSSYAMTFLITNFRNYNQRLGNLDYDVVILKN